jgi:transporter, CPA2 family (2.A.37)
MGLKALSIPMLSGMSLSEMLLLGFALSFSSTVFAIKALQEKGELNATYGTLAIRYADHARYLCRDFPHRYIGQNPRTVRPPPLWFTSAKTAIG